MGVVLLSLAALGILFLSAAAFRLTRLFAVTRRLERAWMADASVVTLGGLNIPTYAITSSFPIVALVGFFRPRMLVARSVLAACPEPELRAIVARARHPDPPRRPRPRAVLALSR